MRIVHSTLSRWLLAVSLALGFGWALASDVVVLHPANLPWFVSFGPEAITSVTLRAASNLGGVPAEKTLQLATATPADYYLVVEGGDPDVPTDLGRQYYLSAVANIVNPNGGSSLEVRRNTTITVDNPSVPTAAAFSYPSTVRANVAVDVLGNKGEQIYYMYFYASAYTDAESYNAQTNVQPSPRAASAAAWVPMVRNAQVFVQGTVYVITSDGTTSAYNVSQQLDLSQGSGNAHWTIDLAHQGQVNGQVALTGGASSSQSVIYNGVYPTASYGISGQVAVAAGSYAIDLPPGDYDLYVRSYAANQYADTASVRVTVAEGTSQPVDFVETLAAGHAPLVVDGFYSRADLDSAQLTLYRQGPGLSTSAASYGAPGDQFDFALPSGVWKPSYLYTYISDLADPALPVQTSLYRFYGDHPEAAAVDFAQGSEHAFAAEHLTLVKANVYFQVAHAAGAPATPLRYPSLSAFKTDYNADQSYRSQTQVYASGSSTFQTQSAFTVVAEPGTYTLDARAELPDGTRAQFGGTSITFGAPVPTPDPNKLPTDPVVLTQPGAPDHLQVELSFPGFTSDDGTAVSTLVETALGPAPPAGFRSVCTDPSVDPANPAPACDPVFYDIKTTAHWSGLTKVCIQRTFVGVTNATAEFLTLGHYKEGDANTPAAWEALPAPPGEEASFDCTADPTVCGCVDEASCGIDLESTPQVQVFRVCGMTSSFSPFAILQGTLELTNTVDGHTYTGANGPPALQTWTVPGNGRYRVTATGARGGSATAASAHPGGCGAEVSSELALHAGDVLQILVGQQGTSTIHSAGGGGGTFVVKGGAALLVAGGGGGARDGTTVDGRDASLTTSGVDGSTTAGYTTHTIAGGTNGGGGARIANFGSGGGGWLGNGASDGAMGEGGFAFLAAAPNQGKGGAGKGCPPFADGGYGGGGAGNGCFGAGGGGGYSGGGGGRVAGGGGSLNTGTSPTAQTRCTANGHGRVTIDLIGKLP